MDRIPIIGVDDLVGHQLRTVTNCSPQILEAVLIP